MLKKPSRFLQAFDKSFTWPRLIGFSFIALVVTSPYLPVYLEYHRIWLDAGYIEDAYLYGFIDSILFISFVGIIKAIINMCVFYAASSKEVSGNEN